MLIFSSASCYSDKDHARERQPGMCSLRFPQCKSIAFHCSAFDQNTKMHFCNQCFHPRWKKDKHLTKYLSLSFHWHKAWSDFRCDRTSLSKEKLKQERNTHQRKFDKRKWFGQWNNVAQCSLHAVNPGMRRSSLSATEKTSQTRLKCVFDCWKTCTDNCQKQKRDLWALRWVWYWTKTQHASGYNHQSNSNFWELISSLRI